MRKHRAVTTPGLVLLGFSPLLTGCAHYEFDIVRPPEIARHVGDAHEERFKLDPLEYRMQSQEGHLVIKAFNPTSETILLLGRMSSAVDPRGESHPLPEQTIAPGSWVKLILPPLEPQMRPNGPTIGIGFGAVASSSQSSWAGHSFDPFYDPCNDNQPRYFDIYNATDPLYWDWDGESDVRLTLVYRRGKDQFEHQFAIHRTRM